MCCCSSKLYENWVHWAWIRRKQKSLWSDVDDDGGRPSSHEEAPPCTSPSRQWVSELKIMMCVHCLLWHIVMKHAHATSLGTTSLPPSWLVVCMCVSMWVKRETLFPGQCFHWCGRRNVRGMQKETEAAAAARFPFRITQPFKHIPLIRKRWKDVRRWRVDGVKWQSEKERKPSRTLR